MVILAVGAPLFADAYVSVKGYYRKDGTYVSPHVRSNPNGLKSDNYSYNGSGDIYNKTYGTRSAEWDTPTYITDPNYYEGKALYESGSAGYSSGYSSSPSPSTYSPSYSSTYSSGASASALSAYESVTGGYKSYGILFCSSGYYERNGACISTPANSYAYGSSFSCNSGYYQSGDICIKVPDNGYSYGGTTFSCNSSYTKSGNDCIKNQSESTYSSNSNYSSEFYAALYEALLREHSCPNNASYTSSTGSCSCNSGYASLDGKTCVANEYYCPAKFGNDYYYANGICNKKEPPRATLTVKSYIKNMVNYLPNESCESMGFAKIEDRNSCNIYKNLRNSASVIWTIAQ